MLKVKKDLEKRRKRKVDNWTHLLLNILENTGSMPPRMRFICQTRPQ